MIHWDSHPVARKPHWCGHCGRSIGVGERYLRQRCIADGLAYAFKAHEDCHEMAVELMDGDTYDGIDCLHSADFEPDEWRGFYPHVVCRFDLTRQQRNGPEGNQ